MATARKAKAKKRGRPKGPPNAKEKAQRRANNLKRSHGALPACTEDDCPVQYPCTTKRILHSEGKGLDYCPVKIAIGGQFVEPVRKALVKGDLDSLNEEAHTPALAMAFGLLLQEVSELAGEGFMREEPVYGAGTDDNGRTVEMEIGKRLAPNRRAEMVAKWMTILGITGAEQATTNKSRGETSMVADAASHLRWLREQNAKLEKQ